MKVFDKFVSFVNEVKKADFTFMIIFSLVVGTATGLLAVYFIKAIFLLTDLLKGMAIERNWLYIVLPAAGGLVVAPHSGSWHLRPKDMVCPMSY